jgi:hypothetical protein
MEMKGLLHTSGSSKPYPSQLTPWCQKTTLLNMQCDPEETECYLSLWPKTCKVMDSHLNPYSFTEYNGH